MLCSQLGPVLCFNELTDVAVTNCNCGDTVVVSEATFTLTAEPGITIACSNEERLKRANVTGSVEGKLSTYHTTVLTLLTPL